MVFALVLHRLIRSLALENILLSSFFGGFLLACTHISFQYPTVPTLAGERRGRPPEG